jgi:hypothetical protein
MVQVILWTWRWGAAVTILIKSFLYLMAFGQPTVLFVSTIGLVCWLLMKCVRAIAWSFTTGPRPRKSANVPRLYLQRHRLAHKPL